MQRSINVHKLRRHTLTAEDLTLEKEEERVFAYLREYTAALALGKDLPETELQPADDLVILAAQALIGLWKTSGNRVVFPLLFKILMRNPQAIRDGSTWPPSCLNMLRSVASTASTFGCILFGYTAS